MNTIKIRGLVDGDSIRVLATIGGVFFMGGMRVYQTMTMRNEIVGILLNEI